MTELDLDTRRELHRGDGPEPGQIQPADPRGDRDWRPPGPEADDGLDVVRERLERTRREHER